MAVVGIGTLTLTAGSSRDQGLGRESINTEALSIADNTLNPHDTVKRIGQIDHNSGWQRTDHGNLPLDIFQRPVTLVTKLVTDHRARVQTGNVPMHRIYLPVQPRMQWEGNFGYCGETSLISAGLYYGQYVSQYDARAIACDHQDQTEWGSQLLIGPGQNAQHAARQLHLAFADWDSSGQHSSDDFLAWTKQRIIQGSPVAVGVYMNQSSFPEHECDDLEYDHIVTVIGVESSHPLADTRYHADDVLVFTDQGIYPPHPSQPRQYIFHVPFSSFRHGRQTANQPSAPVYSLPKAATEVKNCGIAITGIASDGQTLSVRVIPHANQEFPPIRDGSTARPEPPRQLELSITVSGLEPGARYKLYRYNSVSMIPQGDFNKHASSAAQTWDIVPPSETFVFEDSIMSHEMAIYRAVAAAAP